MSGFFVFLGENAHLARGQHFSIGVAFTKNEGIALSIPLPPVISIPLSAVLLGALIYIFCKRIFFAFQKRALALRGVYAVGLIVGGGLSNFFDRLWYDAVIDFFVITIAGRHLAFNIADCAIVIGAVLLFLRFSYDQKRGRYTNYAESRHV